MTLVPREKPVTFDTFDARPINLTPMQPDAPETDAGSVLGAAFRQENVIGSLIAQQTAGNEPVAGYNAWDDIVGTEYEDLWDRFTASNNPGQTSALKRQIDMEREDERTLAAAGGWGLLASIGAGVFSPENLLPGGTIYRGARVGASVARTALSTASAAAIAASAAEVGLHATQETRTPLESVFNVGGAALLGGALGAGASALFSRADFVRLGKQVEAEADDALLFNPTMAAKAKVVSDEMASRLRAVGRSEDDAAKEAALYASFYGTMAARTRLSVDELLKRTPLPEVRAGGTPDPLSLFQPAWHGSPHIFERFRWDESTRGTGEGAQAFGDGLYFAGRREVAQYYRDALAGKSEVKFGGRTAGQLLGAGSSLELEDLARRMGIELAYSVEQHNALKSAFRSIEREIADPSDPSMTDPMDVIAALRDDARDFARTDKDKAETWTVKAEVYDAILRNPELAPAVTKPGRLYKVDIPSDDELLVWDAPISEQPPKVREALKRFGIGSDKDPDAMSDLELVGALGGFENTLGAGEATGQKVYKELAAHLGGQDKASAALREAGIPGHRFLDEGSRKLGWRILSPDQSTTGKWVVGQAPNGPNRYFHTKEELDAYVAEVRASETSNYVIYDDTRVNVTEFEQGDRGSIEFGNPQAIIRLFGTADQSTFLHETGHFFLESFKGLSRATPELGKDWDTLAKYLDIGTNGQVSREAHEKFARSFEAYLRDGKAPSEGLRAAFEQFKEWLVSLYRQITDLNVDLSDDVRGVFDRMLATDDEIAGVRDPLLANEQAMLSSVGAAARPIASLDDNTIAGRGAQVAGGAVRGLNPVLRVLHSPSRVMREIGTQLFENPVYLKKNLAGVASAPAVETLVKEYTQGAMAKAVDRANRLYGDYRKTGGALDRQRWNEAIGKAMRRADQDTDPTIAKAAQEWRAAVFDPLKEEAIKAGLLPKDVTVDTALSYFTRVYNRPLIEAREQEFKGIVRRYIDDQIRGLEFRQEEIRIGNRLVEADRVSDRWRQAFDRLSGIEDRLAGRNAVRRRKLDELKEAQGMRFDAQKERPPAELVKRLRNADENATLLDMLRELRQAERSAAKPKKFHERFPILHRVKRKGGVHVGSFLDHELRNMGVTPQTHPGLFKQEGGIGAVDNWPWDDEDFFMANFANTPDGYIDQNELLNAIRREVAGDPLRTPEALAEDEALDALAGNVEQWLDSVGLPANVSVGDARAFIKRISGAEKAVDDLDKRIARMERELDEFDDVTEGIANERTISEAEAGALAKELNALEEEILEVRQVANASPAVSLIVDYAKVRRDLFSRRIEAGRLTRRVDALKAIRDDGRANDAMLAELAAKTADLNKVLDSIDTLKKRADKLEPMVPRVKQELPEFLNDADRQAYIGTVVDDIFNTITGRNADGDIPRDIVAATRGPLKERTFHIPDSEIEDFLESNVEAVARRYARTMAADIELTRAFGKADLKEQIDQLRADYQRLRQAVQKNVDPETGAELAKPLTKEQIEKRVAALNAREKADRRDLEALRDMIRGSYMARENASNYARVARVAGTVNYLRLMGGVVLASLSDVARHVMVHGLSNVMTDGLGPLIRNTKGFKMSVQEARIAGAVSEKLLNTRLATWADITDPYSVSSPFERFMDNAASGFSRLNGLVYWNDFQKSFASVITQNRVLKGVEKYGSLDKRESAYLAFLGIDRDMASRIAKQFDKHGSVEDGVRVAHTDDWDDDIARRTYRAAINKDVDSTIVTKGVGDVPLFMHTPTGRLLTQFKSFAIASHQRALMRGLQERPMGFVAGTMFAATVGMFIYWLKSVEANRQDDISDNPGRWIAEGLDRSGLFSIAFEANNTVEKAFGIGAYGALAAMFPGSDQSGKASRYATRSVTEALAGPTGALLDNLVRAGNSIKGSGDGWTESEIRNAYRLAPGATLPGIRSFAEFLGVPAVQAAVGN